ncbi:MAG: hypothetical protein A2Z29_01980 [Chloroflexi bacterium RBG_16_56_11]|nr:MAG: hypothetical protein A2Z29_01980 [Chloroflexi bacterium RBG_16_56_11]
MKPKRNWLNKIPFVVAAVLAVGLVAVGCVGGMAPVGWSGGTVSGGTLYVGSSEGQLVAVNLTDESRRWSEQLQATSRPGLFGCAAGGSTAVAIYGSPVVVGDLVYIAGYNGKIYAYTAATLSSRWVFPREGYFEPFVGGLVAGGGKLFVGGSDGKVYALDAATGDKLWEFTTGDKIWATAAFYENTIFEGSGGQFTNEDTLFIGSFDKKLYALNANDGTKKWEFTTGGAIITTPLVFDSTIYVGSFDRTLYALRAADGVEKWRFTGNNWFWAQPAVWKGVIYAGNLDGNVYALDAENGGKVAEFQTGPLSAAPVVVDDFVVFAAKNGAVWKIDTASREMAKITDLVAEVDGPLATSDGDVYIHAQGTSLYRINIGSGERRLITLKSGE